MEGRKGAAFPRLAFLALPFLFALFFTFPPAPSAGSAAPLQTGSAAKEGGSPLPQSLLTAAGCEPRPQHPVRVAVEDEPGAGTSPRDLPELRGKRFFFSEAKGIGREKGVTRRDPSDVIQVEGTFYVWYSKVVHADLPARKQRLKTSGYAATIWYATSRDDGRTWTEQGEALGRGPEGAFDSFAVFTPDIAAIGGRYWLFYTGVTPTPGKGDVFENNSATDVTAIGLAVADAPGGPFRRIGEGPILSPVPPRREKEKLVTTFDSFRVDDAAVVLYDFDGDGEREVGLYYKGRDLADGTAGPRLTKMGLAVAERPEGPYVRVKGGAAVLAGCHEVLVWPHREGVAAYASIMGTIEFAPDGIDFTTHPLHAPAGPRRPIAPGAFRPDLTRPADFGSGIRWGLSMKDPRGPDPYLVRFAVDLAVPAGDVPGKAGQGKSLKKSGRRKSDGRGRTGSPGTAGFPGNDRQKTIMKVIMKEGNESWRRGPSRDATS